MPSVKTHGRVLSGHPLGVLWHAGTVRGGTSRRVPKILDFREWATSGRPLGDQWAPSFAKWAPSFAKWAPSFAKWAIRFGTISLSGRPLMHGRVVSGHTAGALWDGGASGVIYFGVCRKKWFSLSGRPVGGKWATTGRPVSLSGRPVSKVGAQWATSGRPAKETGRPDSEIQNFRNTLRCATPHGPAVAKDSQGMPGEHSAMRFDAGQSQILNGTPGSL